MEKKNIYDAIIIGGGASGLMCAITAKKHDRSKKIAIIEKNDRLGKKLMSTGNGRCNLTNHCISPDKYVGSFKKQSKKIFERFSGDKMANIFKILPYYNDLVRRTHPPTRRRSLPLRAKTCIVARGPPKNLKFSKPKISSF